MKRAIVLLCVLAWVGVACNKEGVGGKSTISGAVMHDQVAIKGAIVYIKYGATAFPGFDEELYDNQTTASTSDASYSFTNLYKGNYYLYAAGEDPVILESVSGGIGVNLETKKEDLEVDIPVVK